MPASTAVSRSSPQFPKLSMTALVADSSEKSMVIGVEMPFGRSVVSNVGSGTAAVATLAGGD